MKHNIRSQEDFASICKFVHTDLAARVWVLTTLIWQEQQAALSKLVEYKREKNGNVFNVTTMGRGGKKHSLVIHPHLLPKILTWGSGLVESQPRVCETQQSSQGVILPITDPQPLSVCYRILQGILTSYWNCVKSLSWKTVSPLSGTSLAWDYLENSNSLKTHSQKEGHKHFFRTTFFLQGGWHLGSGTLSKLCYFCVN